MNGFHIERIAQHEWNLLTFSPVRQPVPGEDALYIYHYVVAEGASMIINSLHTDALTAALIWLRQAQITSQAPVKPGIIEGPLLADIGNR